MELATGGSTLLVSLQHAYTAGDSSARPNVPVFDQGDTTLCDAAGCGTERLADLSVTFTSDDSPALENRM